jgi:peptidoglycan/LPS O-acetylase OafA/YrhL
MLVLFHVLYGRIPVLVIFAICLVVVLAVSWAFYRLVEIPFMNLGRSLTSSARIPKPAIGSASLGE